MRVSAPYFTFRLD